MRLVHVVPAITEEASGPSYSVRRLCDALLSEGADLTLAALDWAPSTNPPTYLKTFPLGWGPRRLGRSPAMWRWLKSSVKRDGVRLIHNHGMWQMNAVYPAWAAQGSKVALVVSPRGALSEWAMAQGSKAKKIFWSLLQRPALESAVCFHATAESEYEEIRRLGFTQPVSIIPNGIDVPAELPSSKRDEYRTLLFLSRIHKVKGLELLLEAWSRLQDRHVSWQLVIAGSDVGYQNSTGYIGHLKEIARKRLLQRVDFVGELRDTDKWRAFAQADLFVLPSYSENFGMAVAEALASGTPCVVTRGAPWSGLVVNNAGWWVDVSVPALTAALDEAMSTAPDILREMGVRGRRWMSEQGSWGAIGCRMFQTYEWLLDTCRQPPPWVRID